MKLGVVVQVCHPSTQRSWGRGTTISNPAWAVTQQALPQIYTEKEKIEGPWQVQCKGTEFSPQNHQINIKTTKAEYPLEFPGMWLSGLRSGELAVPSQISTLVLSLCTCIADFHLDFSASSPSLTVPLFSLSFCYGVSVCPEFPTLPLISSLCLVPFHLLLSHTPWGPWHF